jgi:hypothetical protein
MRDSAASESHLLANSLQYDGAYSRNAQEVLGTLEPPEALSCSDDSRRQRRPDPRDLL